MEKFKITPVEGCEPLQVVKLSERKFTICIGNTRISTQEFKTYKDAAAYVKAKPYELIINSACFCMETSQKIKENENKSETKKNA